MHKPVPIPVFGVPKSISPNRQLPIQLYWEPEARINWNGLGEPATKAQVEKAVELSGGMHLPSHILPALDPGDVLVLSDGTFWIDKDWNLIAL